MKKISLLALSLLLVSCGVNTKPSSIPPTGGNSVIDTDNSTKTEPLQNTRWVYKSAQIKGVSKPIMEGSNITLEFSEKEASGSAGCNLYFGAYEQTGHKISFNTFAATKMACLDNGLNQQEQDFLNHLRKVFTMKLEAQTLRLYFDDENQLIFEAAK